MPDAREHVRHASPRPCAWSCNRKSNPSATRVELTALDGRRIALSIEGLRGAGAFSPPRPTPRLTPSTSTERSWPVRTVNGSVSRTCLPVRPSSGQLDGVLPVKHARAQLVGGLVRRADHALTPRCSRESRPPIECADLLDLEPGGDELGPGGEVDAVEARHCTGGELNAHVHLGRPRLTEHPDLRTLGVAAHDRVVDDDEALATDRVLERVELERIELAQRLRRWMKVRPT